MYSSSGSSASEGKQGKAGRVTTVLAAALAAVALVGAGVAVSKRATSLWAVEPYNPDWADYLTKMSYAVYCDKDVLEAWTCKWCKDESLKGMRDVKVFNAGWILAKKAKSAQSLIGYDADRNWIVVAFRGSENPMNWLADFSIKKVRYPNGRGKVHVGFWVGYNNLKKKGMMKEVRRQLAAHPTAAIAVTGHSLGGAKALFSVQEIYEQITKGTSTKLISYTIGTPLVGNGRWTKRFNRLPFTSWRIINMKGVLSLFGCFSSVTVCN